MFGSFRNQKAVLWTITSVKDGYGTYTFSDAEEIDVRWQDVNEKYIDENGKENVSDSVVYPSKSVTIGSYIYLGELDGLSTEEKANPKLIDTAFVVKKVKNSTDINNNESLVKVLL